ncbi:Phosphate ABC transporter, periplasmic phosphate-binding protein PstS [Planctomycetales bacterium 10988]|nr:Phosphate ABC transporter, periplasmic phosphate-binding protein PstS [Planctomycetales bacterium 10988]
MFSRFVAISGLFTVSLFTSLGCNEASPTLSLTKAPETPTAPKIKGVAPSQESIANGTYVPLSRTIYIYVKKSSLQRPEVATFVKYYVENAERFARQAGYVPLTTEMLETQLSTLNSATQGVATPRTLRGSVTVDGSSTVGPISILASESFQQIQLGVTVPVEISGTGGGFRKFAAGELDITGASRQIKSSEAEECAKNGIEYIPFSVALDGITIVVNPRNDWCNALTVDQIKSLWIEGSEVDTWQDLHPSWPEEPISLFAPDQDSGTFDFFTEAILGDEPCRSDYRDCIRDEVIQKGVVNDRFALGYFGFAYYEEKKLLLNAVEIATPE